MTRHCHLRLAFHRLALAVFLAGLFLPASAFAIRVPLDRILAVVNGEVITWSRLRGSIPMEQMSAARALPPEEMATEIRRLESKYLEELVEVRLQAQEAAAEGIVVSDGELDNAINSIKNRYKLTDDQLARELEAQGLTMDLYRENLRDQIAVSRVVNKVVRSHTVVTDEEVDSVFKKERPEESIVNVGAKVRLITLELKYPATSETKTRIEAIRKKLSAGTPFADLAREYSSDPSAKNGGDLGVIRKGMLVPELENVTFSLEPGKISEPIHIGERVYLLMVDEFLNRSDEIMAARRAIRNKLQDEAFQREYRAWLRKLKAKAHIDIKLN